MGFAEELDPEDGSVGDLENYASLMAVEFVQTMMKLPPERRPAALEYLRNLVRDFQAAEDEANSQRAA
jgi:hypothetical protein